MIKFTELLPIITICIKAVIFQKRGERSLKIGKAIKHLIRYEKTKDKAELETAGNIIETLRVKDA